MKLQNLLKLTVVVAAMSMPTGIINAQSGPVAALNTPMGFQVLGMSPNGKWACGVYLDAATNTYGFRWNLESGSIEMLDAECSIGWDVANDGTIVGNFMDTNALPNGAPLEMPGIWRDGHWNSVEMPEGDIREGIGYGISPDGQYISGSVSIGGLYSAFIWKDGKIHRALKSPSHSIAFCVTPDGEAAAGYSYYPRKNNRAASYWAPDGSLTYFLDSPDYSEGPWNYARNFSADGSKLVYWGGWDLDGEDLYLYYLYDVATGERHRIKVASMSSTLDVFDISNTGLAVGSDYERGYVVKDGEGMFIDDYLLSRGINMASFADFYQGTDYYNDVLPINNIVSVSEDENVMVMTYYNVEGQPASLCLRMDPDTEHPMPVEVAARQLPGLSTAEITWARPVVANNIRGYNVYRNGTKLNLLPVNALSYYDKNLAPGDYTYVIGALTTAGVETCAEAVEVTVAASDPAAPYSLAARQKGVNSAFLSWRSALSDLPHLHYYDYDASDLSGFNVYEPLDFEVAVAYEKAEMANYAGSVLEEVSFVPLAEQNSWKLNIYTRATDGSLQLLQSQPITQPLDCGRVNTVRLSQPISIPAADLVVGIEISTQGNTAGLIGAQVGRVFPGKSDLLRQSDEDDFFSVYDSSIASGLYITYLSWAIDLGIRPAGYTSADLTAYKVYVDGAEAGSTSECKFNTGALENGTHSFEVEALYADGRTAKRLQASVDIAASWPSVADVKVETGKPESGWIHATWSEPLDADVTPVTYTSAKKHARGIHGTSSNSYAIMAGTEYGPDLLRGYDGYKVTRIGFYPLSDALYTLMLFCNDTKVCEIEVDDMKFSEWNYYDLPYDVLIDETATYRLVVDCFDPEPGVDVLALDDAMPYSYKSELYSIDNGETWNSLSIETGAKGNWLMGMEIAAVEADKIEVSGYDVVLGFKKLNDSTLAEPEITADLNDKAGGNYTLRVDTWYPGLNSAVRGESVKFYLETAGVADAETAGLQLSVANGLLSVQGEGVLALKVFSMGGAEVASAAGSEVTVDTLAQGVYLVAVTTSRGIRTLKVNIR